MSGDLYFAYGSNLNLAACPSLAGRLHLRCCAYLPDVELVFDYRSSSRKGGALDLRERPGQAVPGVIYDVQPEGWKALDDKEGCPHFYEQTQTTALLEDGDRVAVTTYVVTQKRREAGFVRPTPEYVTIVRRGLNDHGLPTEMLDAAAQDRQAPWFIDHVFVYGTLMQGGPLHDIMTQHRIQRCVPARPWSDCVRARLRHHHE